MSKSPDAFRTISEVADWLGVQAHVLRFWESKFSQVKPIKRAGGRRYYRPADMLLLGGIRKLLHDDGLTIKGVQKILREQGMAYVSDMSLPLDDETMEAIDAAIPPMSAAPFSDPPPPLPEPKAGEVVEFPPVAQQEASAPQPETAPEPTAKALQPEPQEPAPDLQENTPDLALETQPADDESQALDAAPAPVTPDDVAEREESETAEATSEEAHEPQPSESQALDAAPAPVTPDDVAEREEAEAAEATSDETHEPQPSEDPQALDAAPAPVTPDDVAEREESETAEATSDEAHEPQPSEEPQALDAAPAPVTPDDVAEREEAEASEATSDEAHEPQPSEDPQALDAAPAPVTPDDVAEREEAEAAPDENMRSNELEGISRHVTETAETDMASQNVAASQKAEPKQDTYPAEADTETESQDKATDHQAVPAFLSTSKMADDTPVHDKPDAPAPKPRVIDAPDPPAEDQIDAPASTLSALARVKRLAPEQQESLRPLLAQLTALRDRMAAGPKPRSKD